MGQITGSGRRGSIPLVALIDDLRAQQAIDREDLMLVHPHASGPDAFAEDLESLRAQLDALDQVLLDTVRDRIRCCVRIAEVKRRQSVPMMQPHRIAIVQERAASYAAEHGIDAKFLDRLYDLIIDETCRIEDLVIADDGAAA
jgi:chorismate mutase